MKLISEKDKIQLRHLDILKIKSATKDINSGIIVSKLSSYDKELDKENMDLLDTDYGEEKINWNEMLEKLKERINPE